MRRAGSAVHPLVGVWGTMAGSMSYLSPGVCFGKPSTPSHGDTDYPGPDSGQQTTMSGSHWQQQRFLKSSQGCASRDHCQHHWLEGKDWQAHRRALDSIRVGFRPCARPEMDVPVPRQCSQSSSPTLVAAGHRASPPGQKPRLGVRRTEGDSW